jgi:hypothetical protein
VVVVALVKAAKVKQHFRDIRFDADCMRIRIKSVMKLIDLAVKDTDRTPKRICVAFAVNCLVYILRIVVLLARHVCMAEEVPMSAYVSRFVLESPPCTSYHLSYVFPMYEDLFTCFMANLFLHCTGQAACSLAQPGMSR